MSLKILPVYIYIYIFRGGVKKITAHFIVADREIYKTVSEHFPDTLRYCLFAHSALAKQDFRLKVDCSDYAEIQKSDALTLTYF